MNWISVVLNCANIPVLVAASYAAIRYKVLPKELQLFCWFIFFSTAIQFVSFFLWLNTLNNLFLSHIYVAVGFLLLCWFYEHLLQTWINRKIIRWIAFAFFIFCLITSWFVQTIYTFNSYALSVESILVIILSLTSSIILLNESVKTSRKHLVKSLNWINSGLFIYYTSSLLLFYYGKFIMHFLPIVISKYIWVLHAFFSSVMYLCFFIGLWKRPRN